MKVKNKHSKIVFPFLAMVLLVCLSCNREEKYKEIKLAHGLNTAHPVHRGMEYMAKRLEEKSEGKLRIKIYHSQQLGTERQCLELLQIGSIGMTKVSAAVMENFAPVFKILSLPYVFKSKEHSHQVFDGEVGKELLNKGGEFWLKGLCFYDAGSRSFYSKERLINTPDDLKGMKIRVMPSNTAVNMIQAFGGAATPISWGELYTALQGGVVDGAENNPPSFYLSHHYEVCKYYILNEHTTIPDVLLISTHTWNQLSDQEKIWLQEAVAESVVEQRKLWEEAEQEALDAVEAAGVEIIRPDKEPFIEKVQDMLQKYSKDPEIDEYIKKIEKIYKKGQNELPSQKK